MKIKEIRDLTPDEIKIKIKEKKMELMGLRIKLSMRSLDNPKKIMEGKRDLARMLTILKEKGAKK